MKLLAAGLLLTATMVPVRAQEEIKTERLVISVTELTNKLNRPWGLAFLPDKTMLVTEKIGTLRRIAADGKKSEPIAGVPKVDARDQGGLLGIAIHPQFEQNRLIYMSFSEHGDNGTNSTAVVRAKLSEDMRALEDPRIIFSQKPKVFSAAHFGSRLVFGGDGKLFVTLGERFHDAYREQAQDLGSHLGKIVRLNDDGSVPKDNPFVGKPGALPEIWSYGHRNIQGATINPDSGQLWVIEHGPSGGDEINIAEPGKNYGWPVISYGVNYDGSPVGSGKSEMAGMEKPIYQWTPVIAPGGATFYTGDMFQEWAGNLFVAGLKVTELVRLEVDGNKISHEERLLTDFRERIRDVVQGPDGALYVLTDEIDGVIWRIARVGQPAD